MKSSITTFILAIFFTSSLSSQSFLDTLNCWNITASFLINGGYNIKAQIGDPVIINGTEYYGIDWEHVNNVTALLHLDDFFFREEEKKVYYVYKHDDYEEKLLYDFDLEVGDTIPGQSSGLTLKVIRVDSISSDQGDKKRKIMELMYPHLPDKETEFVVEGIGNTDSPFNVFDISHEETCVEVKQFDFGTTETYRFQCNGNYITSNKNILSQNDFQIYPNPTADIIELKLSDDLQNKIEKIQVFDMQGRMVLSENDQDYVIEVEALNSGIYILTVHFANGEKGIQRFIKS